jgi:hypothetical protein
VKTRRRQWIWLRPVGRTSIPRLRFGSSRARHEAGRCGGEESSLQSTFTIDGAFKFKVQFSYEPALHLSLLLAGRHGWRRSASSSSRRRRPPLLRPSAARYLPEYSLANTAPPPTPIFFALLERTGGKCSAVLFLPPLATKCLFSFSDASNLHTCLFFTYTMMPCSVLTV